MQCSYIKQDGSQCWANAMSGSEYCWFHAPEVDYDRKSASRRGGQVKRAGLYCDLNPIPLKYISDVPEFLMDTIRQVRGGYMGGKIAVTIGYLCSKLMKSFEEVEMDRTIKKIEDEWKKMQRELRKMTRGKKKPRRKKSDVRSKALSGAEGSKVRNKKSEVRSQKSE